MRLMLRTKGGDAAARRLTLAPWGRRQHPIRTGGGRRPPYRPRRQHVRPKNLPSRSIFEENCSLPACTSAAGCR